MQPVMKTQDAEENVVERIVSRENMPRAGKRVKENDGVPGVDKMTVDEVPEFLREHWQDIRESLLEGTSQPAPV